MNGNGKGPTGTSGTPMKGGANGHGGRLAGRGRRRSGAPSLDADELEAIRLAVEEKLRHQYHQTDSFIADKTDEMVAQAYIELAEAWKRGVEISSKVGWLITTAVRRSIDAARRDGREIYGEGAELVIENAQDQAPSTEALAIHGIEAAEVYAAVEDLPEEQRQALSLYYWEGMTTRQGAEAMGLNNPMTFMRRRDVALDALRERFGIKPDDPIDKYLAIEAGFAAWACLMVNNSRPGLLSQCLDGIVAAGESVRQGITGIPSRAKELGAKLVSSGGSENIGGAISNGTAGSVAKIVTTCAAGVAILYCGATGVIGPGLGGGDSRPDLPAVVKQRPPVPARNSAPLPSQSAPAKETGNQPRSKAQGFRDRRRSTFTRDHRGHRYSRQARHAARNTFTPEPVPEEPVPEPEPSYVGEPEGGGEGAATAAAQEQFGLP
jgi:RNA polymerase sigma factor (sigma-70 family)